MTATWTWLEWGLLISAVFFGVPMFVYCVIKLGADGFYKSRQEYINRITKGEPTDEHAGPSEKESTSE